MKWPRDSQRSKVYSWERSEEFKKTLPKDALKDLSIEDCKELVTKCYHRFGLIDIPEVYPRKGYGNASYKDDKYSYNSSRISLPEWSRHGLIVIHETAHGISRHRIPYNQREPAHGKTFVKIMINLLSYIYKIKTADMRQAARNQRVRVSIKPYGNLPPSRLAKENVKGISFSFKYTDETLLGSFIQL